MRPRSGGASTGFRDLRIGQLLLRGSHQTQRPLPGIVTRSTKRATTISSIGSEGYGGSGGVEAAHTREGATRMIRHPGGRRRVMITYARHQGRERALLVVFCTPPPRCVRRASSLFNYPPPIFLRLGRTIVSASIYIALRTRADRGRGPMATRLEKVEPPPHLADLRKAAPRPPGVSHQMRRPLPGAAVAPETKREQSYQRSQIRGTMTKIRCRGRRVLRQREGSARMIRRLGGRRVRVTHTRGTGAG